MKSTAAYLILIFFISVFSTACSQENNSATASQLSQLAIENGTLVNAGGEKIQLRGMSLFWSQWQPQFYNYETVENLVNHWGVNVVRAAMAAEHGGYLENPEEEKRNVMKVIDAAIDLGIYVIIDWHDHHAENHLAEAKTFFSEIAEKYGSYPNIIYEPYNEPLDVSWSEVLKPYHEEIISAIREFDDNNIIVLGTPNWSQRVDLAAEDPVEAKNIAYTLHFYAGTHKEDLRHKAEIAMEKGLAIFVTEYGTTNADGDGAVDKEETRRWFNFMDANNISWCNWSIADKDEASAAVKPGTTPAGLTEEENFTTSGKFVRTEILKKSGE